MGKRKKEKEKKKKSSKQQYGGTPFYCLKKDRGASDVARRVDTPHRGNLEEMKRRPRPLIMKLFVLRE